MRGLRSELSKKLIDHKYTYVIQKLGGVVSAAASQQEGSLQVLQVPPTAQRHAE